MWGNVRVWAACGVLAFGAAGPARAPADEVKLDFKADLPPEQAVVVGTDRGGCSATPTAEGLRVVIPEDAGQKGPVGVRLRRRLKGDFVLTAGYTGFKAGPPRGGYGAGVVLVVEADDPARNGLTAERQTLPKAGEKFTSTHIFTDGGGERQYRPSRAPAAGSSGRLRLTRTGATATAEYDDGGGEFRVLKEVELGSADVNLVRLACNTGQSACAVEVVFTSLDVRADGLEPDRAGPPGAATAARRREGRFWGGLAALGVVVASAALVLWRRRGPAAGPAQVG